MADQKVTLHYVNSCNLGKLGSDGVALKLNFAMSADEMKTGPYKSAVFGLSHKSARGLAQALVRVLLGQLIQIRKSMAALETNAKNGRAARRR